MAESCKNDFQADSQITIIIVIAASFSPSSQLSSSPACQTPISHISCLLSPHKCSLLFLLSVHPDICFARISIREQLVVQWIFGFLVNAVMQLCWCFMSFFVKYTSVSAVREHREQKDWLIEIVREANSFKFVLSHLTILFLCVDFLFKCLILWKMIHDVCVRLVNYTFHLTVKYYNINYVQ